MSHFLITFTLFVSTTIGSDYYYVNKMLNWADARQYCKTECNSDLVSIHYIAEFNDIISNSIPYRPSSHLVWIGLKYNSPSFEWTDQISSNYFNWYSSDTSSNKHCVQMTQLSSYRWQTRTCSATNTFICSSCHHNIADNAPSYHINPNILTWDKAESYCENHCNSNLASIHNERDNVYAKYLANNGIKLLIGYSTNVSIGLHKPQSASEWEWKDGSIFDYGNNYKPGEYNVRPYPWTGELLTDTQAQCVRMRSDWNYEFQQTNASDLTSRFMCNSCDSKLNKYIVVNTKKTYSEANIYCKNELNMSLASIHSMSDYNEAKLLCQLNNNGDCYIGLSSGKYEDNTEFDFGTDTTGNYIVLSQADGYEWKAIDSSEQHVFICNMPSQFCNNDWSVFGGNGWTFDKTDNCNGKYSNNGAAVMMNKQFMNTNGELLIELIYSAENIIGTDVSSAGIMLFNIQSDCDYYYISITPETNSKLALGKVNNDIYDILAKNDTITFQLGISYVLKLMVIDSSKFEIYVNNKLMIEYTDTSNINSNVLSGYIGIMNRNLDSIFRSLHVSGAEWIYNTLTCDVALYNTIAPTKEPTINPTHMPTHIPTHIPSVNPTINPSFQPTYFPSFNPTFEPTYNPTTEPTDIPTYKPTEAIDLKSGSVDDKIATTIIVTQQNDNKKSSNENDILFLHIIYVMVAIVICCLISICILLIYIKKHNSNAEMNREKAEKRLELEKTKPEPIKIKITKRHLTTDDSVEQMYGETDFNDEMLPPTAGETPITATTTSTGNKFIDGNDDLLNESDSDSDIENDYIHQMYEKPTTGKITKGLSQRYINVNSKNDNDMILPDDSSESDDNMYNNNKFAKETKTSGET